MYRYVWKTNEVTARSSGLHRPSGPSVVPASPGTLQFARSLGNQAVRHWVHNALSGLTSHPVQRVGAGPSYLDEEAGECVAAPGLTQIPSSPPVAPIPYPNISDTQGARKAIEKVLIEPKETVVEPSSMGKLNPGTGPAIVFGDEAGTMGGISSSRPLPAINNRKNIPASPHAQTPPVAESSGQDANAVADQTPSFSDMLRSQMGASSDDTSSEQQAETESGEHAPSFSRMLAEQIEETREE